MRVQQEQREAGLGRHAGDAADRDVRAAGAVEEVEVDVDRRAVPAAADRHLAVHPVEVQRLSALVAGGAAHDLARAAAARRSPARPGWWSTSAISCTRAGSTPSVIRKTSEPKLAPSCRARTSVTTPAVSTGPTPGHLPEGDHHVVQLQV